jgi:hypothetical protein
MSSESIQFLALDTSFPDADPRTSALSQSGLIRFIDDDDSNTIEAMNRFAGDLVNRFVIDERKINEIIEVLNGNPRLVTFDNTPYVLVDGTHPFTSPVEGVSPTSSNHLAPKGYVDDTVADLANTVQSLSSSLSDTATQIPAVRRSDWTEFEWMGGVKQVIDFTLATSVVNVEKVIAVYLMEELTLSDRRVYRQLYHGTSGDGLRVDDLWLADNNTVRALIPSTSSYSPGYPSTSDYGLISTPVSRRLRAIVIETT